MQARGAAPASNGDAVASAPDASADEVFESVAELFGLLATPIRLKIIGALCQQEKNVSQLLAEIPTTQPNMSQHLSVLYRAGILGRRRESTQMVYRLENERVASLCRTVCMQAAIELEGGADEPADLDGARLRPTATSADATRAPRR